MTKAGRSELMSRIRSRRTGPEMVFHGILKGGRVPHEMWPDLPGRPDCLIIKDGTDSAGGTCVFVHGCFWHGCPRHFRAPRTNRKFWVSKIARNAARHRRSAWALRKMGFRVVVVWEHDLRRGAVDNSAVRRRATGVVK